MGSRLSCESRPNFDSPLRPSLPVSRRHTYRTGDFFQLPPVADHAEAFYFAFQARSWQKSLPRAFVLKEIYRQTDPVFVHHLNTIRRGAAPPDTAEFFRELSKTEWTDGFEPVIL